MQAGTGEQADLLGVDVILIAVKSGLHPVVGNVLDAASLPVVQNVEHRLDFFLTDGEELTNGGPAFLVHGVSLVAALNGIELGLFLLILGLGQERNHEVGSELRNLGSTAVIAGLGHGDELVLADNRSEVLKHVLVGQTATDVERLALILTPRLGVSDRGFHVHLALGVHEAFLHALGAVSGGHALHFFLDELLALLSATIGRPGCGLASLEHL